MNNTDSQAVEALVRAHGENFMNQDVVAQTALWDKTYPNLTLLPTERTEPIDTWEEIVDYYNTVIPAAEKPYRVTMQQWDITALAIDFLSDDVAYAIALVDSEYDIIHDEPPPQLFAGYGPRDGKWLGRLTYIVHRTDSGWRIIHCEDSTLDTFRADQLKTHHDMLIEESLRILEPIVHPPIETSLTPGSSAYIA